MMGGYGYGPGWMWGVGALMMLPFWAGLAILTSWAVSTFVRPRPSEDSPDRILKRRLAAGQISPEDYDRISRALRMPVRPVQPLGAASSLPEPQRIQADRIRRKSAALLAQQDRFPIGSRDLFLIRQTEADYLPAAVSAYEQLLPDAAVRPVTLDGRTGLQVLQRQLDMMEAKLDEVALRLEEHGVRRLVDHGRLLEEKIGAPAGSELTIPGPIRPARGRPRSPRTRVGTRPGECRPDRPPLAGPESLAGGGGPPQCWSSDGAVVPLFHRRITSGCRQASRRSFAGAGAEGG